MVIFGFNARFQTFLSKQVNSFCLENSILDTNILYFDRQAVNMSPKCDMSFESAINNQVSFS